MATINTECRRIAKLLKTHHRKLVLAESCTAGMVAASLGRVAGISRYFCGSLVSYRDETKTAWLKIPLATLLDPGAVSETVARLMAEGALASTPEANLSASITGHLGPHAPHGLDGIVFNAVARRDGDDLHLVVSRLQLTSRARPQRQREATLFVLRSIVQTLDATERRG